MRIFILSIIFVLIFIPVVFSHTPSNIDIKLAGVNVEITVSHSVSEPTTHYVEKIEVVLNGKKVIEQNFFLQSTDEYQRANYTIPSLKKGDVLEVIAHCSRHGKRGKKITVQ